MDLRSFTHWVRRTWPVPTTHDRRALELYKSLFLISILVTGFLRQCQIEEFFEATHHLNVDADGGLLAPVVAWLQADFTRFSGFNLGYCALAFAALFRVWTRAILVSLFVAHFFLVRVFEGLANQSEVLAPYFLIFLLFVDFRSRRRRGPVGGSDRTTIRARYLRNLLALRGLQLQMALFYVFNGVGKAMHAEWLQGRAAGHVVFMEWSMTSDLRWLADYPVLSFAVTYTTLAYELLFPVWVSFSRTRGWAIAFGVLLHTIIAVAMNQLVGLSLMTIAALFLFRHPRAFLDVTRARLRMLSIIMCNGVFLAW